MTDASPHRQPPRISWPQVAADLAPIACDTSPVGVRRKSRDYFWFSPVLSAKLNGIAGDLVASPADEAELVQLARYCAANNIPLTPRGAGTGNYGQGVPLHGGIIADLSRISGVKWVKDGVVRALAGTPLMTIDTEVASAGFELRFYPSTWKTATVGGFVAGGSGGVGAINYGSLYEPGTVLALRILTLEDEPRTIELRGAEAIRATHAYGATGIITEVELALAPRRAWWEYAATFPDLMQALRAMDGIARAGGFEKKELAVFDWNTACYFDSLLPHMSAPMAEGDTLVLAMIGEASREPFVEAVAAAGGKMGFERAAEDEHPADPPPLYEYCWNHTTMHALKHDRGMTYLQTLFTSPTYLDDIAHLAETFGDEVPMHVEFSRVNGDVRCFGMQLLRFTTEERLNEIIDYHQRHGCIVYNPHTFVLEAGRDADIDPAQVAFKNRVDPYGLLNPGKLAGVPAPEGGFFVREE